MSITVNIMSYKYGHLVAQSIESVLSQTLKPDVIRIYDDGIGDCIEVCKLYPEVEYILREKNLGIIDNFNDALERTTTDKVMFLGADNWLHPQALEALNIPEDKIVTCQLFLVGTEAESFSKGLPYAEKDGYLVWKPDRPHGSSLYDVKLAKEVGGYIKNPDSIKSEEDSMLFRKMMSTRAYCCFLHEPFIYYRRHKHNFQ